MPAKWHKYSYTAQREERRTVIMIVLFLVILLVLFTFIHSTALTMYRVKTETMRPTLQTDELVISTPLYSTASDTASGFSLLIPSRRGDIVVIGPRNTDRPGRVKRMIRSFVSFVTFQRVIPFSANDTPGKKPVIRRLLGLPGDSLYMDKGILYIKPSGSQHFLTEFELVSSRYELQIDDLPEAWDTQLPFSLAFQEITLGEGEYFVLCDNRIKAGDSRIWGPVSAKQITGRVIARYWPLEQLTRF